METTGPEILIVEDEWIIASDIKASLNRLGYCVSSSVSSGEEAVSTAGVKKPDLVLMDIVLPGQMNGIEAAELITARFDIPVVYLTSYSEENILTQVKKSGAYGYLIKPFRDTELKAAIELALYKHRMEMKLRENEKKLFTTLNSINDAVISTDEKGLVTFMNPLAQSLTGHRIEDIKGKALKEIFEIRYSEEAGSSENIAAKLIRNNMIVTQMNYTLKTKHKWDMNIELSAAPIIDEHGGISGMVIVFNDITKRIQMEEELKKYRSHLEEIVRDRTIQLTRTNEQLQQEITERKKIEEQIKASLKEKDILLKEIHHRVGNNLQVIYGMLSIQTDFVKDSQSTDIFRGFQNRIMSMALAHKLLYRSGDLANIDMNDYIHKLAGRLYDSFGVGTDRVALKIDAGDVSIGLDTAIACGLIINEIVSNALKHAFPEGREGEIRVTLYPLDKETFELKIRDNGIGLPENMDFRNSATLGFRTIASYEDSGPWGKFELNRENGTEFRIRLMGK